MSYFDVELNMLDGLSVDSGGTGSLNRLWLDKLVINGDTTDMVTAVVTRFNGSVYHLTGSYNASDMSTSYAVSYNNPRLQTDTEFVYLTVQTPAEIQSEGLDNTLILRRFKFPDDLPINYQPQLDSLDDRLDDAEDILAEHEVRLDTAESTLTAHGTRITSTENRITATENKNVQQDTRLTNAETRITATENKNTAQDTTLASHGNRITAAENKNTAQDSQLANHESRITNAESTVNTHTLQIHELEKQGHNFLPLTIIEGNSSVNIDSLRSAGEWQIAAQSHTSGQRLGSYPDNIKNLTVKVVSMPPTQPPAPYPPSLLLVQIAYTFNAEYRRVSEGTSWNPWQKISESADNGGDSQLSSGNSEYRIIKTFELPLLQGDSWGNSADSNIDNGWFTLWANNRYIRPELTIPWSAFELTGSPTHLNSDSERMAAMRRLKVELTAFDRDDTNALSQMGISCAMRVQSDALKIQLGAASASSGNRYCRFFIRVLLRNEV